MWRYSSPPSLSSSQRPPVSVALQADETIGGSKCPPVEKQCSSSRLSSSLCLLRSVLDTGATRASYDTLTSHVGVFFPPCPQRPEANLEMRWKQIFRWFDKTRFSHNRLITLLLR
eukprot:TRINITY_DN46570_c0_g1_i1.p1 TRINITY_DN46570_c0_g1~~TRINITY_DN46570_c0_g1_i1.p1  ORF type:complete len:115 (+),score=13.11 TRINITY_DN46570_c0_g1_i1:82-426(+)